MKNYQLEEITTTSSLRSQLSNIFRSRKSDNSKARIFVGPFYLLDDVSAARTAARHVYFRSLFLCCFQAHSRTQ